MEQRSLSDALILFCDSVDENELGKKVDPLLKGISKLDANQMKVVCGRILQNCQSSYEAGLSRLETLSCNLHGSLFNICWIETYFTCPDVAFVRAEARASLKILQTLSNSYFFIAVGNCLFSIFKTRDAPFLFDFFKCANKIFRESSIRFLFQMIMCMRFKDDFSPELLMLCSEERIVENLLSKGIDDILDAVSKLEICDVIDTAFPASLSTLLEFGYRYDKCGDFVSKIFYRDYNCHRILVIRTIIAIKLYSFDISKYGVFDTCFDNFLVFYSNNPHLKRGNNIFRNYFTDYNFEIDSKDFSNIIGQIISQLLRDKKINYKSINCNWVLFSMLLSRLDDKGCKYVFGKFHKHFKKSDGHISKQVFVVFMSKANTVINVVCGFLYHAYLTKLLLAAFFTDYLKPSHNKIIYNTIHGCLKRIPIEKTSEYVGKLYLFSIKTLKKKECLCHSINIITSFYRAVDKNDKNLREPYLLLCYAIFFGSIHDISKCETIVGELAATLDHGSQDEVRYWFDKVVHIMASLLTNSSSWQRNIIFSVCKMLEVYFTGSTWRQLILILSEADNLLPYDDFGAFEEETLDDEEFFVEKKMMDSGGNDEWKPLRPLMINLDNIPEDMISDFNKLGAPFEKSKKRIKEFKLRRKEKVREYRIKCFPLLEFVPMTNCLQKIEFIYDLITLKFNYGFRDDKFLREKTEYLIKKLSSQDKVIGVPRSSALSHLSYCLFNCMEQLKNFSDFSRSLHVAEWLVLVYKFATSAAKAKKKRVEYIVKYFNDIIVSACEDLILNKRPRYSIDFVVPLFPYCSMTTFLQVLCYLDNIFDGTFKKYKAIVATAFLKIITLYSSTMNLPESVSKKATDVVDKLQLKLKEKPLMKCSIVKKNLREFNRFKKKIN